MLVLLLRVHRLNGILIKPWTSVLKVPMVSLGVQSRDHTPRYAAKLSCKQTARQSWKQSGKQFGQQSLN